MMNQKQLEQTWRREEDAAHIHGWDFSHIHERYEEENDLPWDYKETIARYLKPEYQLLDLDTGGGEFLLSLQHPHQNTSATEAYPPNAELCRKTLAPLGIDFHEADAAGTLPFPDGAFDMVVNRHGSFQIPELFRVLKPGGIFLTQQVGAKNDRELVELLLPGTEIPFPDLTLERVAEEFKRNGFHILLGQEAFRPIKFYDVGALVWFARVIEWEFPGFSVDRCFSRLWEAQRILEKNGCVEGTIHRFLLTAQKAEG